MPLLKRKRDVGFEMTAVCCLSPMLDSPGLVCSSAANSLPLWRVGSTLPNAGGAAGLLQPRNKTPPSGSATRNSLAVEHESVAACLYLWLVFGDLPRDVDKADKVVLDRLGCTCRVRIRLRDSSRNAPTTTSTAQRRSIAPSHKEEE